MSDGRSTTFHLNLSLLTPGHFRTAWRRPGTDPTAYLDVEHFRRLVRIAEDAKVHAVFLGDSPSLNGNIGSAPEGGLDPLVLLTALVARHEHIGVVITSSTTYNHPYNTARRFLALDHVTGGRAAVNIVTTYAPNAAANFGHDTTPPKDERYRRAHEFLDVVTKLWGAWDDDAVVADQASGVFVDTDRVHPIDHHGEFYDVRGPLSVPSSPQGRPVIVQAGGSAGGLTLAGDFADVVFTVAQTPGKAVAFRDDVRARAVAVGRGADDVKVSLGVVVLVAATTEEAERRAQALYDTIPIEQASRGFAVQLGLDPEGVTPDTLVRADDLPDVVQEGGSTGFLVSTRALLAERPLTLRELVHRSAGGGGHRLVVGSAEQVADDLEAWWRAGAADGFTVMPAETAVDLEAFATLVIPILQERGLFHTEYEATTLRAGLGLPVPRPARAAEPAA